MARGGEGVAACCDRAGRSGVRVGMPLAEAAALLERGDRRAAACCRTNQPPTRPLSAGSPPGASGSALVGWETITPRAAAEPWFGESPGHLFFDVTGMAPLFGGEDALARLAAAEVRGLGRAHGGRGTLGASWALRNPANPLRSCRPAISWRQRPLPVARLRLPADVLDLLTRLGVLTVEQLARLSRAGGSHGGSGRSCSSVSTSRSARPARSSSRTARCPLSRRTAGSSSRPNGDELDWALAGLIDRVAARSRAYRRGAVLLTGRFDCGPEDAVTFEVGLFRPVDTPEQPATWCVCVASGSSCRAL